MKLSTVMSALLVFLLVIAGTWYLYRTSGSNVPVPTTIATDTPIVPFPIGTTTMQSPHGAIATDTSATSAGAY